MKSNIMKQIAAKLNIPMIDVKLVESKNFEPSDFLGQDLSLRGAINETVDGMVNTQIASPEIHPGDMVLMEYASGIVEHVVVEAIEDGIVYGLGDDGEPYCSILANCDKVPV